MMHEAIWVPEDPRTLDRLAAGRPMHTARMKCGEEGKGSTHAACSSVGGACRPSLAHYMAPYTGHGQHHQARRVSVHVLDSGCNKVTVGTLLACAKSHTATMCQITGFP